jgi:ribosomal protein L11 methylase PrmA
MLHQNAFPLLSVIGEFMHERSILIYSGFLTEETETIRAELARNGFDIQDLGTQDEWAVIRAKLS